MAKSWRLKHRKSKRKSKQKTINMEMERSIEKQVRASYAANKWRRDILNEIGEWATYC